jgi:hypothetical protein
MWAFGLVPSWSLLADRMTLLQTSLQKTFLLGEMWAFGLVPSWSLLADRMTLLQTA